MEGEAGGVRKTASASGCESDADTLDHTTQARRWPEGRVPCRYSILSRVEIIVFAAAIKARRESKVSGSRVGLRSIPPAKV